MFRLILALQIALSLLLTPGMASADPLREITRLEAGLALFQSHCRRCHRLSPANAAYGPPLAGIIGRPSGTVPGYEYSDALGDSRFLWTRDTLRFLLTSGDQMIYGLRCRATPSLDAFRREILIDFLEATGDGLNPKGT